MPTTIYFKKCICVKCFFIFLLLLLMLPALIKYQNMKNVLIDWADVEIKPREGTFYICPLFMGRLGNNMFQYATAYGIATEKNMSVMIPSDSIISKTFNVDAVKTANANHICSTFSILSEPESFWGIHNKSFFSEIYGNKSFCIKGYFQSFKYFNHLKNDLKKQLMPFSENTRRNASMILRETRRHYLANLNVTNLTLVGVHIRMGDMLNEIQKKNGIRIAPREYFLKAMDYFNSKYKHTVFLICGENQTWAREMLQQVYTVNILNQSSTPDVDLAILSMCDHMIMSIGSYSWWSAYLNVGKIVYYKDWIVPGSFASKGYRYDDYFPTEWIPM